MIEFLGVKEGAISLVRGVRFAWCALRLLSRPASAH